jgi:hypothetical protein
VALICVAESTTKAVAPVPPKETALAPVKLLPVMMTVVPPPVGPEPGLIADMLGGLTKVN